MPGFWLNQLLNWPARLLTTAKRPTVFFPSDEQRINLRKAHLLEARASLKALDVRLTHCYTVMMQNPEGCFTTSSGRQVGSKEAIEKLDRMAANLGEMIDHEDELIKGNIKSVGQSKAKQ